MPVAMCCGLLGSIAPARASGQPGLPYTYVGDDTGASFKIDQLGTVNGHLAPLSPSSVDTGVPVVNVVSSGGTTVPSPPTIARAADGSDVFIAVPFGAAPAAFGTEVIRYEVSSDGTLTESGSVKITDTSRPSALPGTDDSAGNLTPGAAGTLYYRWLAADQKARLATLSAPSGGGLTLVRSEQLPDGIGGCAVGYSGPAPAYDAATATLYVPASSGTGSSEQAGVAAYAIGSTGSVAASPYATDLFGPGSDWPSGSGACLTALVVGAGGDTVYADIESAGGSTNQTIYPMSATSGSLEAGTGTEYGSNLIDSTVGLVYTATGPAGPALYALAEFQLQRIAIGAGGSLTPAPAQTIGSSDQHAWSISANNEGSELYVVEDQDTVLAVVPFTVGTNGGLSALASAYPPQGSTYDPEYLANDGATLSCLPPEAPSPSATRGALTAPLSPCNLRVTFTPTPMLGGLSRDGAFGATFINESTEACMSGCEKITVTVTNDQNQKIKNALIEASVTPITTGLAAYASSAKPSSGYLCSATAPTQCGSGALIDDLRTNGSGQVSLLYWPPPVTTKTETAKITVKAQVANCGTSCSNMNLTGENTMPITVKAHVIYQADMDVPEHLADVLAEWKDDVAWIHIFGDEIQDHAFDEEVEKAAEYFIEEEKIAEEASTAVTLSAKVITKLIDDSHDEQLMDIFLAGLQVSPTGLGDAPDDRVVSLWPGRRFRDAMIEKGNVMGIGSTGLLWKLALDEATEKEKHKLTDQTAHLNVFEVSFCTQGKQCGPGYHDESGIQPYLDFELTVGIHDHTILPYTQIVTPYNAHAWMLTQFLKR